MTSLTGALRATGPGLVPAAAPVPPVARLFSRLLGLPLTGRGRTMVARNLTVVRHGWLVLISGFFEPLFYLLSIGIGIGHLVGGVHVGNQVISYRAFVAPAMLATSALNGAVMETFNVFHKLKFAKVYDSVLATPVSPGDVAVGEIAWSLMRGGLYSVFFLAVMAALGLISSWWALLALPAVLLLAASLGAVGMAGTTFMRTWQDFELIDLVQLPMFLFSATFYPLSTYPGALQVLVRCTPLYQGVAMLRALTTGQVGPALIGHAAYLLVLGGVAVVIAARRLEGLLLR